MSTGPVGASALRYWEHRQAAVANNLANASTTGFKAERVFAQLLGDATLQVASATDFSGGQTAPTGRPLDVALIGEGFLVVDTPEGQRWSRGGSLNLGPDGQLLDAGGRPVLGGQGNIVLPPGEIEITSQGRVFVDGEEYDQLRIERPRSDSPVLERAGETLWVPSGSIQRNANDSVRVEQGYLEDSNVNTVSAMVEMIEIQRAYTAVQRSLITEDSVMDTIANQIGRVG